MNSIGLKEIETEDDSCLLLLLYWYCWLPVIWQKVKTANKIAYHFDEPARTIWEETLPLGSGGLGMMPDGGINKENILLNEISMWFRKQTGYG